MQRKMYIWGSFPKLTRFLNFGPFHGCLEGKKKKYFQVVFQIQNATETSSTTTNYSLYYKKKPGLNGTDKRWCPPDASLAKGPVWRDAVHRI